MSLPIGVHPPSQSGVARATLKKWETGEAPSIRFEEVAHVVG